MADVPDAIPPGPPWVLSGQAGLFLLRSGRLLALVEYTSSPVGPYLEVAILRLRGWPRVTSMWVNSEASQRAGRRWWGFPKSLADMEMVSGQGLNVLTVETFNTRRSQTWTWTPYTRGLPLVLNGYCRQTLNDGEVRVPVEFRGRVHPARWGHRLGLHLQLDSLEIGTPLPT